MIPFVNSHRKKITFLVIIALTILISCKERYEPQLKFGDTGFLVVEGYINIGTKALTTIMLSRTTPVHESKVKVNETGALVSIENSQGDSFQLSEIQLGTYVSDSLNLSATETYRLRISISDKIYYSEFVTPIITPEIDSVSWSLGSEGIHIGVFTHDETDKTKQYQWEFEEVWEVKSPILSLYDYNGGNWQNRTAEEMESMQTCWSYTTVTNFNIFSTSHLAQNLVFNRLVKSIPLNDLRLDVRYSIRVKQHALSNDAYNYIQLMISNSENLGTFYDPMPGELTGNIYCTSTPEPVVGFIEAYSTTTKRIFIHSGDVPNWNYQPSCRDTLVGLTSPNLPVLMQGHLAFGFHLNGFIRDSVYLTTNYCADCRVKGGTNLRPPFWEFGEDENNWVNR